MHVNNIQKKIISEHDKVQSITIGIIEINNDNSIQACPQLESNNIKTKGKRKVQCIANDVRAIREPQQPNWGHNEVIFLVHVKRNEHMASLDVVDS